MVIKENSVRKRLWSAYFRDGKSKQECVTALVEFGFSCKTEVYATLKEFEQPNCTSWQYQGRARDTRRCCAGGLTPQELQQLKSVIDQDRERDYAAIASEMAAQFHVRISSKQIAAAIAAREEAGGLYYSFKVKQHVAVEKQHALRKDFRRYLNILIPDHHDDWHKVVFFDEMHRAAREGTKKKILGPKGVPAVSHESFSSAVRQTFTVLAAISTSGVVDSTVWIRDMNVDADIFYYWVKFFLCPSLGDYSAGEPNSIVIGGAFPVSCSILDMRTRPTHTDPICSHPPPLPPRPLQTTRYSTSMIGPRTRFGRLVLF